MWAAPTNSGHGLASVARVVPDAARPNARGWRPSRAWSRWFAVSVAGVTVGGLDHRAVALALALARPRCPAVAACALSRRGDARHAEPRLPWRNHEQSEQSGSGCPALQPSCGEHLEAVLSVPGDGGTLERTRARGRRPDARLQPLGAGDVRVPVGLGFGPTPIIAVRRRAHLRALRVDDGVRVVLGNLAPLRLLGYGLRRHEAPALLSDLPRKRHASSGVRARVMRFCSRFGGSQPHIW